MAEGPVAGVLQVLHGGGGGLESAVSLAVEQTRSEFRHVLLYAETRAWKVVRPEGATRVRLPGWRGLKRIVRECDLDCCHVHHWLGDRARLLRQLRTLDIPYGLTVHDHYLICPRIHLVPPGGQTCGAPADVGVCRACLKQCPRIREDPKRWRDEHRQLLEGAQFVLAPSESTSVTLTRIFPDVEVRVVPHAYSPPGKPIQDRLDQPFVSVGVVGGLGPEKGGAFVEELAASANARGIPLRFVVLGDTHRHGGPQSLYDGHLFVHGGYRVEDLPGLLQHYRIAIAAFPAFGPETFSFTLSEVWACGIPALVPALGALAERVNRTGGGWVIQDQAPSVDVWIDTILARMRDHGGLQAASRKARAALVDVDNEASELRSVYRQALGLASC